MLETPRTTGNGRSSLQDEIDGATQPRAEALGYSVKPFHGYAVHGVFDISSTIPGVRGRFPTSHRRISLSICPLSAFPACQTQPPGVLNDGAKSGVPARSRRC